MAYTGWGGKPNEKPSGAGLGYRGWGVTYGEDEVTRILEERKKKEEERKLQEKQLEEQRKALDEQAKLNEMTNVVVEEKKKSAFEKLKGAVSGVPRKVGDFLLENPDPFKYTKDKLFTDKKEKQMVFRQGQGVEGVDQSQFPEQTFQETTKPSPFKKAQRTVEDFLTGATDEDRAKQYDPESTSKSVLLNKLAKGEIKEDEYLARKAELEAKRRDYLEKTFGTTPEQVQKETGEKFFSSAIGMMDAPVSGAAGVVKNIVKGKAKTVASGAVKNKVVKILDEVLMSDEGAKVYQELDTAMPGQRIPIKTGGVNEPIDTVGMIGQKSSFPQWISPELRSTKLVNEVKEAMIQDTLPKSKPGQRLYNEVADELYKRTGTTPPVAPKPKPKPPLQEGGKMSEFVGFDHTTTGNKLWNNLIKKGEATVIKLSPDDFLNIRPPLSEGMKKVGFKDIDPKTDKRVQFFVKKLQNGEKLDTLLIDNKNDWYDGIHRALAAKEVGIKEIPVAVTDPSAFAKSKLSQPQGITPKKSVPTPKPKAKVPPPEGTKAPALDISKKTESYTPTNIKENPKSQVKVRGRISKFFTGGERILRESGTGGKQMAEVMEKQRKADDLLRGKWFNHIDNATKKLSKEELDNLDASLRGEANPMNSNVAGAYKSLRNWYDSIGVKAQDMGLEIKNSKGVSVPFKPRENYAPQMHDFNKLQKGKHREAALDHLVESGQARNKAEATKMLDDFIKQNAERRYANLERAREIDLPGFERNPITYSKKYAAAASKRFTELEHFGKKDEKIAGMINRIVEEGGDYNQAQKIFDYTVYGAKKNKIVDKITQYNLATQLDLAAITNATQTINTAAKGGLVNTGKGIVKSFTKKGKEVAELAGVYDDFIYAKEAGVSLNKLVRAVMWPFQKVENFNRRVAANVGQIRAKQLINREMNDFTIRKLKELGIDAKNIKNGRLSKDDMLSAAYEMARQTQFKVDPLDVPAAWKTPGGKLAMQFQSFAFMQTKFIRDSILKEAKRGNFMPLVRFIPLAIGASFAANYVRNLVTGRDPKDAARDMDIRAWDKWGKAFGDFATNKIIQGKFLYDTYKSDYNTPLKKVGRTISSVAGPTAGKIMNMINALESIPGSKQKNEEMRTAIAKGKVKPKDPYLEGKRTLASEIPFAGEYIKNKFFSYPKSTKSPEEKETTKKMYGFMKDLRENEKPSSESEKKKIQEYINNLPNDDERQKQAYILREEGFDLKGVVTSENSIKAKELYSQWKDLSTLERNNKIAAWKKTIGKEQGTKILSKVMEYRKNDLAVENGLETEDPWMNLNVADRASYLVDKTRGMNNQDRLNFLNKIEKLELVTPAVKEKYKELWKEKPKETSQVNGGVKVATKKDDRPGILKAIAPGAEAASAEFEMHQELKKKVSLNPVPKIKEAVGRVVGGVKTAIDKFVDRNNFVVRSEDIEPTPANAQEPAPEEPKTIVDEKPVETVGALKAESFDREKFKKATAIIEQSGKTSGDWMQFEESTLNDLKKRYGLDESITKEQMNNDPDVYDQVVDKYKEKLEKENGLVRDYDKILWLWRPGWFKKYDGDVNNIPDSEIVYVDGQKILSRNLMIGRKRKLDKFLSENS
jgi:hypothetical protein